MSTSSDQSENVYASDSQVLDRLDSVSLPSEPPDINNWFSSYIYESPELNSSDGLRDSDGSGGICIEEEKKQQFGEIGRTTQFFDALRAAPKESSEGIVKYTNLHEGNTESSIMSGIEANFWVKTMSPAHLHLTSERAEQQPIPSCETRNDNHGSVKKLRTAYLQDTDYAKELGSSSIDRTKDNVLHTGSTTCSHHSLIRKDGVEERISKENDGFISTRKKTSAGNVAPEAGAQRAVPKHDRDGNKRSKVLQDKTNFHYVDVVEHTGKWHCPQKKKPNHGPPLKQLRLEHWVVRHVKN